MVFVAYANKDICMTKFACRLRTRYVNDGGQVMKLMVGTLR